MAESVVNQPKNPAAETTAPAVPVSGQIQPQPGNPSVKKPANRMIILVIATLILIILLSFIFIFSLLKPKPPAVIPAVTPTPVISTPSPMRQQNPVATTSAFMDLDKNLSDLSKEINNLSVQDTNLYPPVIDLQLGFSN